MTERNNTPFTGIESLTEWQREKIIADAEAKVAKVNADTRRAIAQSNEEVCSQAISEALSKKPKISRRERYALIDDYHRKYKVHEYSGGN